MNEMVKLLATWLCERAKEGSVFVPSSLSLSEAYSSGGNAGDSFSSRQSLGSFSTRAAERLSRGSSEAKWKVFNILQKKRGVVCFQQRIMNLTRGPVKLTKEKRGSRSSSDHYHIARVM